MLEIGRKLFLIIRLIEARRQKGDHHENINKTYASRGKLNGLTVYSWPGEHQN